MKDLAEKLERMLPYFDLDPGGAYAMHARRHPVRPHRGWLCVVPIAVSAFICGALLRFIEFDEAIEPLPLSLYVAAMAAAAALLVLAFDRACAVETNPLSKGAGAALLLPATWLVSVLLTGVLTETVLSFLKGEAITILCAGVQLAALVAGTAVLFADELRLSRSEGAREELRLLEGSPGFREFYGSEANVRRGWRNRGGRRGFRTVENAELVDRFELGGRLRAPEVVWPEGEGGDDARVLRGYREFVRDEPFRRLAKDRGDGGLLRLFSATDGKVRVCGSEGAGYLLLVRDALALLPAMPFDVERLGALESFALPGAQTPNANRVAAELAGQRPVRELAERARLLRERWEAFAQQAKEPVADELAKREALSGLLARRAQGWKVLRNVRLDPGDEAPASDIVVVCPHGVFAVEVRRLDAAEPCRVEVGKDGAWRKVRKDGRCKEMGAACRQNSRRRRCVRHVVNEALGRGREDRLPVTPLIAFAGDVLKVKNDSSLSVVRASKLVGEIGKRPVCLSKRQVEAVAAALEERALKPPELSLPNFGLEVLGRYLDVQRQASIVLPQIEPLLSVLRTLAAIPDPPVRDADLLSAAESFALVLADDESEYRAPVRRAAVSHGGGGEDRGGSRSCDDEYERAVGSCEYGNSYSYSWYEPGYVSYNEELRDTMGMNQYP